MSHRILFAGTPQIAVPLLEALVSRSEDLGFEVAGILTNPDSRQGRSSTLVASPVKIAAENLGLPVLQFDSLKTESRKAVRELGADTLVTFAFGKIFGPMFLSLFSGGCFNVHPSRLPELRGASPVQATIHRKLKNACISLQNVGEKMDEGDIWTTCDFSLEGTETTLSLSDTISHRAAEFVPKALHDIFCGKLVAHKQTGNATYCGMIDKNTAFTNFTMTAEDVHAHIRAMYPHPKAWTVYNGAVLSLLSVWGGFAELESEPPVSGYEPGSVVEFRKDRGIGIACADKLVWVTGFQLSGKKELDFKAFINGNRNFLASRLGS